MIKDTHTEHCCFEHGCKYGDPQCTVTTGTYKQSYPCENCEDPKNLVYKIRFKENGKYKAKGSNDWNYKGGSYDTAGIAIGALKNCIHKMNEPRRGHVFGSNYKLEEFEIVEFIMMENRVIK